MKVHHKNFDESPICTVFSLSALDATETISNKSSSTDDLSEEATFVGYEVLKTGPIMICCLIHSVQISELWLDQNDLIAYSHNHFLVAFLHH